APGVQSVWTRAKKYPKSSPSSKKSPEVTYTSQRRPIHAPVSSTALTAKAKLNRGARAGKDTRLSIEANVQLAWILLDKEAVLREGCRAVFGLLGLPAAWYR